MSGEPTPSITWRRLARWAPFLLLAAIALRYASFPHLPRKPFSMSLDLAPSTLALVAYKPIHYRAAAVLFWLALFAVGPRRKLVALTLTLLVCLGIELCEATVAGHNARLADMLSYGIGAGIGLVVMAVVTTVVQRLRAAAWFA